MKNSDGAYVNTRAANGPILPCLVSNDTLHKNLRCCM